MSTLMDVGFGKNEFEFCAKLKLATVFCLLAFEDLGSR